MNRKKKKINESIAESAISPLSYIVFVDADASTNAKKGYLNIMFPSETPDVIRGWFRLILDSKDYSKSKDIFAAIGSRFSTNPSLIVLFKGLAKLKSQSFTESEKEQHESDIQTMIRKISIFIKRKLTEEDTEILESMLEELNGVSEKISKKIDEELEQNMVSEEEQSEPEEKQEKEEEEPKTEVKVNERLKNKLRKKIKEIIRTNLISNRYR
jgi:hypothetical protein